MGNQTKKFDLPHLSPHLNKNRKNVLRSPVSLNTFFVTILFVTTENFLQYSNAPKENLLVRKFLFPTILHSTILEISLR